MQTKPDPVEKELGSTELAFFQFHARFLLAQSFRLAQACRPRIKRVAKDVF